MKKYSNDVLFNYWNLLVISNTFPYSRNYNGIFIKEQLRYIQPMFNKVTVISPCLYFPNFFLKFKGFERYTGYNAVPRDYIFQKMNVIFPKYFPMPIVNFLHEDAGSFNCSCHKGSI